MVMVVGAVVAVGAASSLTPPRPRLAWAPPGSVASYPSSPSRPPVSGTTTTTAPQRRENQTDKASLDRLLQLSGWMSNQMRALLDTIRLHQAIDIILASQEWRGKPSGRNENGEKKRPRVVIHPTWQEGYCRSETTLSSFMIRFTPPPLPSYPHGRARQSGR